MVVPESSHDGSCSKESPKNVPSTITIPESVIIEMDTVTHSVVIRPQPLTQCSCGQAHIYIPSVSTYDIFVYFIPSVLHGQTGPLNGVVGRTLVPICVRLALESSRGDSGMQGDGVCLLTGWAPVSAVGRCETRLRKPPQPAPQPTASGYA